MSEKWARPKRRTIRGLGDVVQLLAHPVAVAADAMLGTNLQGCSGCRMRQASLNARFPLVKRG